MELTQYKVCYEKNYFYNIHEKNFFKKIISYIKFIFKKNQKQKTYYKIINNKDFFLFNKILIDLYNILFKNKHIIQCLNIEHNNFNILEELKKSEIIEKNYLYIYKIKINKNKNFVKNIDSVIDLYFTKNNIDMNFINTLKILRSDYYEIYKNLECVKLLFYIHIYTTSINFMKTYNLESTDIILNKNNIFLFSNQKKILLEKYKLFVNHFKQNNLQIDTNKTFLINKHKNNFIYKNQILTPILDDVKIFDKHALYLIDKYKKNKTDKNNPLIMYNIKDIDFLDNKTYICKTTAIEVNMNDKSFSLDKEIFKKKKYVYITLRKNLFSIINVFSFFFMFFSVFFIAKKF